MKRQDWLCLVAVHADCWLMAMTFYNAAKVGGLTEASTPQGRCRQGWQPRLACAHHMVHPHSASVAAALPVSRPLPKAPQTCGS